MRPGYFTTGGARHELPDLRFTPSGVRKEVIEGYVAVGGERRQWFSRGQMLLGYANLVRLGVAQPPHRMEYDGANLTYQALTLAGDDYSIGTAMRVASNTFFGFGTFHWYRFVVSGNTITVTEYDYPAGWATFGPSYSFELDGQLYAGTGSNNTSMRRITPDADLLGFTFVNITRLGGSLPTSPSAGVQLGDRAFIIMGGLPTLTIYEITITGNTFAFAPLTGPSSNVIGTWGSAVSDGRRIFVPDNTGDVSMAGVAVVEVSGNVWSATTVSDVPALDDANWAVRV